jgi:uncharacterized protein with von Willebrand factor type A (vWA) domain
MTDWLHRFLRAARAAGVRISAAEAIDAGRAVAAVGVADRTALRDALLLTLAKTAADKEALAACFDAFFAMPGAPGARDAGDADPTGPGAPGPAGETGGSGLAQMLASGDSAGLAAAVANAAAAVGLEEIRIFTQRGLYATRMMAAMGGEALQAEIDAQATHDPAAAERLVRGREALRDMVTAQVNRALGLYGREHRERLRAESLASAPLARLDRRQAEEMRALVRRMARQLQDRFGRRPRRQRRGQLDLRRTMRRNAGLSGIPFHTVWRRRRRDTPRIVALCDVSGSVARVADFFLLLIHSLHDVVPDVRSFAFSSHLVEVSDMLAADLDTAMQDILAKVGYGSSDYGTSLADFAALALRDVDRRTTVVMLGDARSNHLEPRTDLMRMIAARAKRVVWLNPETPASWGLGDSVMPRYAPYCNLVRPCATARQLERAVSQIIAADR